jgi:exodeoxyribonuclease VII large subunit
VEEVISESDSRRHVYSVSDLLAGLNALFEDRVGRVWVVGEVSNLHAARSGHSYFSLKDDGGQIRAALFRSAAQRVPFKLEDGLEVLVYAEVGIYQARGELQLIVRQVEPRGRGALQLAFEQMRQQLQAEGLFDADRKRPLPPLPRRLAVVTSPTSAAVRDVIEVSGQRFPAARLLVVPTRVQGEGAEHEIAQAIDLAARQPDIDVVLIVRGGGSLEDLWAFNTETVARAIAGCPLPTVTGVGHETDLTIADLVADVRAPTPSAAAMQALPARDALAAQVERDWRRLVSAVTRSLRDAATRLSRERDALRMLAPSARLSAQRRRLHTAWLSLERAMRTLHERRSVRLSALAGRLDSLSPLAVLSRGYALVRRADDAAIVRAPGDVAPGDALSIRLADGELRARAEGPEPAAEE